MNFACFRCSFRRFSFKRLVFLLYIFALVFVQGITDLLRDTQLTETGQQEVEAQFGSVLKSMPLGHVPETPLKRPSNEAFRGEDVASEAMSCKPRLSLYMAVTGGNDWSMYFDTLSQCGLFYTILFLLFNFFFVLRGLEMPRKSSKNARK